MTRILLRTETTDPNTRANLVEIQRALNGGLGLLSNFNGRVLSGTTSGTPNTQLLIKHGLERRPLGALILSGNVYVNAVLAEELDIRSSVASAEYTVYVLDERPVR